MGAKEINYHSSSNQNPLLRLSLLKLTIVDVIRRFFAGQKTIARFEDHWHY